MKSLILDKLFTENATFAGEIDQVLLLGTGGGSDILSALLFAAIIRNKVDGINITNLAGMLSPGSKHFYGSDNEQVLNEVRRPNKEIEKCSPVRRFIVEAKEMKEISFVDAHIWHFIDEFNKLLTGEGLRDVRINNVYHFSTQFGMKKLTCALDDLLNEDAYSEVIGLDVGGDITASKMNDRILSPLMDLSALMALNGLGPSTPRSLVEMGWGSDGENKNFSIRDYFGESQNIIKNQMDARHDTMIVKICKLFFQLFSVHISPIRAGHTIPLLLNRIIYNTNGRNVSEHIYQYRIGDRTILHRFDVETSDDAGKIFEIDIKELCDKNCDVMVKYDNPLFHCAKLKSINGNWASEIDGRILEVICDSKKIKLGCALFSKSLPEINREKLIYSMIGATIHSDISLVMFVDDYKKHESEIAKRGIISGMHDNKIIFISNSVVLPKIFESYSGCTNVIKPQQKQIVIKPQQKQITKDWLDSKGGKMFASGEFTPVQIRNLVPKGVYCYDKNGLCPFWSKSCEHPEQNNGYCGLLKKGDCDLVFGLLWDQCKECCINVEEEEEENS